MAVLVLNVTLGLAIALLLRRPVRRLMGAGPAFTLWLWPVLLALVPCLPMPAAAISALPPVLAQAHAGAAAALPSSSHAHDIGLALWGVGAALALLRLALAYVRLRRAARPVSPAVRAAVAEAAPGLDPRRLREHRLGPAVLWAPRSLVLLPADFAGGGDPANLHIVLAHECSHLRRGDPLWTLLAEIAVALLWFHPLAWLALPRFRLDQELACDERTLRAGEADAPAYARTLLASTGMDVAPVLIPWLTEPQLKERLTMIQRHPARSSIRRTGTLCLALAGASLALAVQASSETVTRDRPSQDLSFNARQQPAYPKASILNNEQGTVMLRVRVKPDGTVKQVYYDPEGSTTTSGNLIAAASQAAMQWHFNPAEQGGHPIESDAKVPVTFSITTLPDDITKDEAEKKASEYAKNH